MSALEEDKSSVNANHETIVISGEEISARLDKYPFVGKMLAEREVLIDQGIYFHDPVVATLMDMGLVVFLFPELYPELNINPDKI